MQPRYVQLLALVILQISCTIITSASASDPDAAPAADGSSQASITVDYIVVGGGSAGSVVATRLSENLCNSVLLLDGGDRSHSSVGGTDYVASRYKVPSPGNAVFSTPYTRYDVPAFCYTAVADYPNSPTPPYPLKTSFAGTLNTYSKILGGNSVHNYMVWDRLTPYSINSWNVSGWSYDQCLPYWKKSEDATKLNLNAAAYRGTNGPIRLNYAQAPDPAGDAFINGCVSTGLGYVSDINDPNHHVGCGRPQFNINDQGIRASSVNQYLAPALNRSNLRLITKAMVIKVLFSNSYIPRAIGVQYLINGVVRTAYANKEIVLSAGTFNTPKILLLSGIGPAAHLNSLNIPVIADLPVGKRMSLHPVTFAYYKYNITSQNPYQTGAHSVEYAVNGTGVFASTGVPAEAKLKSKSTLPDFDLNVIIAVSGYEQVGVAQFVTLLWGSKQNNGTITLQSTDYNAPPLFTYTPLQNQEDVAALVSTLKIFRQIANSLPGKRVFGEETQPGAAVQTDEQLRYYLRNGGSFPTITHLHGGVALGNENDPTAVLDPRLRVKRVCGLRVADLSIVPGIFLGGPMANGIMFGERAAAFILADN